MRRAIQDIGISSALFSILLFMAAAALSSWVWLLAGSMASVPCVLACMYINKTDKKAHGDV